MPFPSGKTVFSRARNLPLTLTRYSGITRGVC
jgi:hypothetical protein